VGGPADRVAGSERRRQEVLERATEVFARRGYASATVQDIADELGILKGSIYYYIDSKEDLLFELFEQIHAEMDRLLEQVRAADAADPLERLGLYVRSQTIYNLTNLMKVSVYYNDLGQLDPERRALIERRRVAHEAFVGGLIKEAQAGGLIDGNRDPRVLVHQVFAIIIGPYRWFRPRGRPTVDEIAVASVQFVTAGLRDGTA
jgi:AcrR family transcriptional regulator